MCISTHTLLKEDRQFRCVIKNIPKEIDSPSFLSDLKSQNIPVLEVHRMHRGRHGAPYDMVMVVCENSDAGKAIANIRTLCHLSGITVERPNKNRLLGQCHRCQLYGHAQRNCFAKARCVKCLGDHATVDCTRPKDPSQCAEPPSCVLCGEIGHPANYRGCPKAPRSNRKASKQIETRQQHAIPSAELPNSLRPQRPSPWNKLNHQQAFPAVKPQQLAPTKTIPPLMACPIPAPASMLAPPTAPLPRPQPSSAPKAYAALSLFFNPDITARSDELLEKLKIAQGNPIAIIELRKEYSDLAEFYTNFRVCPTNG